MNNAFTQTDITNCTRGMTSKSKNVYPQQILLERKCPQLNKHKHSSGVTGFSIFNFAAKTSLKTEFNVLIYSVC